MLFPGKVVLVLYCVTGFRPDVIPIKNTEAEYESAADCVRDKLALDFAESQLAPDENRVCAAYCVCDHCKEF